MQNITLFEYEIWWGVHRSMTFDLVLDLYFNTTCDLSFKIWLKAWHLYFNTTCDLSFKISRPRKASRPFISVQSCSVACVPHMEDAYGSSLDNAWIATRKDGKFSVHSCCSMLPIFRLGSSYNQWALLWRLGETSTSFGVARRHQMHQDLLELGAADLSCSVLFYDTLE